MWRTAATPRSCARALAAPRARLAVALPTQPGRGVQLAALSRGGVWPWSPAGARAQPRLLLDRDAARGWAASVRLGPGSTDGRRLTAAWRAARAASSSSGSRATETRRIDGADRGRAPGGAIPARQRSGRCSPTAGRGRRAAAHAVPCPGGELRAGGRESARCFELLRGWDREGAAAARGRPLSRLRRALLRSLFEPSLARRCWLDTSSFPRVAGSALALDARARPSGAAAPRAAVDRAQVRAERRGESLRFNVA